MINLNRLATPLLITIAGIIFFFPFLGSVHLFDWDEINFAESAREMLLTGNYFTVQIDFQPFTEKPPLFFWLQTLSMKAFGINEFAARFPNAVFGVLTLLSLYYVGKDLFDKQFGLLWALSYLGSFLPHLYFKSGIIDPVFNFFIFMGVVYLFKTVDAYMETAKARRTALLSGVFIGLAVLTKGPVGFLLAFLTFLVFWSFVRFRSVAKFSTVLVFSLSIFIVSLAWYGAETYRNGFVFISGFIVRQIEIFTTSDAGHGQPFYYHFLVVLLGCFPISILGIKAMGRSDFYDNKSVVQFRRWMICLFWVVMTVFSISTTKIVHYSSMTYFPLSFLAAYHLNNVLSNRWKWSFWTSIGLIGVGFLFGVALIALPLVAMFKERVIPYIDDPFVVGNLAANVIWGGWEWSIGIVFLILLALALWMINKGRVAKGIYLLFFGVASTVLVYTSVVVPKIEGYTQAAPIRFYKSLAGKDVYIHTLWFKSYAHLYYSEKQPSQHSKSRDENWLLAAKTDKPVYVVVKKQDMHRMEGYPDFTFLREENGFAFYLKNL